MVNASVGDIEPCLCRLPRAGIRPPESSRRPGPGKRRRRRNDPGIGYPNIPPAPTQSCSILSLGRFRSRIVDRHPLDLADGAARVYDPIVRGEAGEDLHGVFLKDYAPTSW